MTTYKMILGEDFVGRSQSLDDTRKRTSGHWEKEDIFEGKQPGEKVDSDLGYTILDFVKVTVAGRPYPDFREHNQY